MKKITGKKTLSSSNHRGHEEEEDVDNKKKEQELEILRAVAQAWHGHFISGSSKATATNECDARRLNFKSRPSRFKLEAMNRASSAKVGAAAESKKWDFNQSLLDSYELVSVARRLERGGLLSGDNPFDGSRVYRKKRESKSSLRNLLSLVSSSSSSSSKRFSD